MSWWMRALVPTLTVAGAPIRWLNEQYQVCRLALFGPQFSGPIGSPRQEESMHMKRAVGYCENTDCEDYVKGVFLLNHGDTFYCPQCRQLGKVEREQGSSSGDTNIFKEVRVEFGYNAVSKAYQQIAIVRDDSLGG